MKLNYLGGEKMTEKETLTQLVKLARKDTKAFENLYSHVINKVYYWCYTLVKDEGIAGDLAQESMIKMYDKFHHLKKPETFTTWMYTLVRNICYDYLRANKHSEMVILESEPYFKESLEESSMDHLPEESYDLEETKKIIIELIETLPRKQREVITLFYLEEFKITEISNILDCKVGIVKSRLHSGRNNLETQIKEYQEKHGTKLYSGILLPLLGSILKERRENLFKKKNLKYDQSLFQPKGLLKNPSLKGLLSVSPLTIVGASLGLILMIGVGTFIGLNHSSNTKKEPGVSQAVAFDKSKQNTSIESITYNSFPTQKETQVVIHLKKDKPEKDIKISLEGKEIPFAKQGKDIQVRATENGAYDLKIGKENRVFTVDQINQDAPELKAIKNRGSYLELIIQDKLGEISYERSYLEYQGKTYKITKDQKVWGEFKGTLGVYLYNQADQYVYYEFNLK